MKCTPQPNAFPPYTFFNLFSKLSDTINFSRGHLPIALPLIPMPLLQAFTVNTSETQEDMTGGYLRQLLLFF
jgi:hypothetical protein